MNELIKIKNQNGKDVVSAKELYLGLDLEKSHWNRWSTTNILQNDFFKRHEDWEGFATMVNGNETLDFVITLDFAKHLAMMAKTEKSHEYRNYFLQCEKKLQQPKQLTPQEELRLHYKVIEEHDTEIKQIKQDFQEFKLDMPLFNIECEELQKLVQKIGIKCLGGKTTPAYKNNSLRGRVYSDIQKQLIREFGTSSYKAIKRTNIETAKVMLEGYKLPLTLKDEIILYNNQLTIEYR